MNADTFEGLSSILYLSLADNNFEEVPEHIWPKLPNLKTVDLGRAKIKCLSESSFKVRNIFLYGTPIHIIHIIYINYSLVLMDFPSKVN